MLPLKLSKFSIKILIARAI